jgi:ATP-binding cassette subfamily C protein
VLVTGWFLVRGDLATVGAVTAAALYFHRLFNPLGLIVLEFDMVQQAGASLARLVGVSSLPPPPVVASPPVPVDAGIEVRGVRHRYDGGPPVLRDVSLRIAPGERVALVGASGAGKTTLAGLAAGLLTPSAGSVLLGGVTLDALGAAEVRRRIGLISQEVHVFSGTLLDDVTLARASSSEAEVVAALDLVGALEWARALPDGLRTHVGEGAHQLTAAQAQQVALARLVLMDPDVAVLDEATAEAGSAGARELDRAADAATAGRTTLIVAHRLSQAARADRVVVLDHGEVVEVGRHEDLVDAGGRYAELWRSWSGGH